MTQQKQGVSSDGKKMSRRTILLLGAVSIAGAGAGGIACLLHRTSPGPRGPLYIYHGASATFGVAWSPDGKRIAACFDRIVQAWDALSGNHVFTYNGLSQTRPTLAWSPDGKFIASANDDGAIEIWNATSWLHIATFQGRNSGVCSLAWSSDNTYLASGGDDMTVQVWRTK